MRWRGWRSRRSFSTISASSMAAWALPALRLCARERRSVAQRCCPLRGWLNITGKVREGRLRLSFGYGRKRYRRETVERLAGLYETALRELVDHCTSGASGLTPSDVALSGLARPISIGWERHLDLRGVEDIYPLSPMQQGMLFHALRDGENDAYVNQVGLEVLGFDADKLRAAWQAVSDRHAVLRTGFVWRTCPASAQQVVYRHVTVPFVEEDWRDRAAALERSGRLDAALAEVSRRERESGFDLSRPPLQRVRLIRLDDRAPLADLDPSSHPCRRLELGAADCGGAAAHERRHAAGGAGQLSRLHRLAAGPRSCGRRNVLARCVGRARRADLAGEYAGNEQQGSRGRRARQHRACGECGADRTAEVICEARAGDAEHAGAGGMGAVAAAAYGAGRRLLRRDRIGPAGGTGRLRGDGGPVHQHVADRRRAEPASGCRRLAASVAGPEPGLARAWLDAALRDPASRRTCRADAVRQHPGVRKLSDR